MSDIENQIEAPINVPLKKSTKIQTDWLTLDYENPRLVSMGSGHNEEKIISQLYRSEELEELLQSIAANGYLDIEPMIVLLNPDNKYTVLEGNRRLAALKLFSDPELVKRIGEKEKLNIRIPELKEEFLGTLKTVSVYRVNSRDEARSFIGFKHINGAAKWESYAKAKFAADWYRDGSASMEEIAEKIGDRHATIKKMVWAIYVLEQAENQKIFDLEDRFSPKFNFSHLYTALSRTQYMAFLGLNSAWSTHEPSENPIAPEHSTKLKEILSWMYGSRQDKVAPIIQSQNPDIKRLAEVLGNSEGVHVLRATRSLDEAHSSTQPAEDKFASSLIKARGILREAANNLRGFDGKDDSLTNIAEDILETSQTIHSRMMSKSKVAIGKDE